MQQIGIYEQLITQVIEQNLNRDQFYVGERQLESAEAWLRSLAFSRVSACTTAAI